MKEQSGEAVDSADLCDRAERMRDARRDAARSLFVSAALAVLATGGATWVAATIPSRSPADPWWHAIPQLDLSVAVAVITALLVAFGLGVFTSRRSSIGPGDDEFLAALTGQRLRELAFLAGPAGMTIALWGAAGAVADAVGENVRAGVLVAEVGAALTAGLFVGVCCTTR